MLTASLEGNALIAGEPKLSQVRREMGKGFLQTVAETMAGAHPDAFWLLAGYRHVVHSGSKVECEDFQKQHPDTKLVGSFEIGEYMVVSRKKL